MPENADDHETTTDAPEHETGVPGTETESLAEHDIEPTVTPQEMAGEEGTAAETEDQDLPEEQIGSVKEDEANHAADDVDSTEGVEADQPQEAGPAEEAEADESEAETASVESAEAEGAEAEVESAAKEQEGELLDEEEEEEKRKRRRLLILLGVLLLLLCCVASLFYRYVSRPAPLPDLLPVPVDLDYAPHYLFSIYGVDQPVGVALSPAGDRLYVAETGGERLIKVFDREGNPGGSFAPPRTRSGERSPVYLATDDRGRVFVSDRLQHAVFVYNWEGNYLDTILAPDLTLSEYLFKHRDDLHAQTTFVYNVFWSDVYYQEPGEVELTLPAPDRFGWSPLGIRIDGAGEALLTDVDTDRNLVRFIPAEVIRANNWRDFEPPQRTIGETGQGNGQLLFPNAAVRDALGRLYVTDGNNGRISVWDDQGQFLFHFGQGAGDGALNLPRGAAMGVRDRLHVVDAVGQNVKVYDVSGPEPAFLFVFGDWGTGDGQFNYPNDIALDASGRLYIADRENNRIQVWSY